MKAEELASKLASQDLLPSIYRAVEPAYPHEGCGFVFKFGDELKVLPTKNRAQELHEKNPDRYPRGGKDWFEPDMKPWLKASREGGEPQLIFHSHPDVGAYFSDGDRQSAVVENESGERLERHPGVQHIVVSVRDPGTADGAKMFTWDEESATFVQAAEFDADGKLLAQSSG
jgi:adenylyltransferase/sulfurtransferase